MVLLGEIPPREGGKAEGITVLEETDSSYEVIIVFDGLDKGSPMRYRVLKREM